MKKQVIISSFLLTLLFASESYANWFQDIINAINKQGFITNGWLSSINTQQGELLQSQRDIDELMKQMNGHLTGNSGWGTYQFHDYQSYGGVAEDWSGVMQMANMGYGAGDLGQTIGSVAKQFPIDSNRYNAGVSDHDNQKYYALKSQTILAARAASQLDYNKIQDQIAYQQMLQQQIEKTKDVKAALDLSNRIQVEGNLINLEILRQTALVNQQQAISDQASVNSALSNAKFLINEEK